MPPTLALTGTGTRKGIPARTVILTTTVILGIPVIRVKPVNLGDPVAKVAMPVTPTGAITLVISAMLEIVGTKATGRMPTVGRSSCGGTRVLSQEAGTIIETTRAEGMIEMGAVMTPCPTRGKIPSRERLTLMRRKLE